MNVFQFKSHASVNPDYHWNFLVEIDSKLIYLNWFHTRTVTWDCTEQTKRDRTNYIGSL